jgi:hypothetical protein
VSNATFASQRLPWPSGPGHEPARMLVPGLVAKPDNMSLRSARKSPPSSTRVRTACLTANRQASPSRLNDAQRQAIGLMIENGPISAVLSTSSARRRSLFAPRRELVPTAAVVAMLVNPNNPNAESQLKDVQAAAGTLGKKIHVLSATTERDIDTAFAILIREQAGAPHRRHRSVLHYPTRPTCLAGGAPCGSHRLLSARVRHGRRPDELWNKSCPSRCLISPFGDSLAPRIQFRATTLCSLFLRCRPLFYAAQARADRNGPLHLLSFDCTKRSRGGSDAVPSPSPLRSHRPSGGLRFDLGDRPRFSKNSIVAEPTRRGQIRFPLLSFVGSHSYDPHLVLT